jgi:ABC-2 type transport system ATP-binding protein
MANVTQAECLRKVNSDNVAVDDVSFSVAEGEIYGLLGRNGAGKITSVECVQVPQEVGSDPSKSLFNPVQFFRPSRNVPLLSGVKMQPDQLWIGELLQIR